MDEKKLHVLLIHQAFVSLNEAGGTRHYELASYLASRGHRVTVITSAVSYLTGMNKVAEETNVAGLEVLKAPTLGGLHRSFVLRLVNFFSFTFSSFFIGLTVRGVDVVWGTTPPIFQAASAWALARLKRAKFLLEVRDLWPAFAVAVGVLRSRPLIAASEWLERFLYRHADNIVLNSPGFFAHVQTLGGHHIAVVPNGSDPTMFDPNAHGEEFRQAYGLQDKFVVLYAGAHGLSNDLGVVLAAAELLRKEPKIALVLLGDGKEKPRLQDQARQKELANLFFVPSLPKAQVAIAFAAADACLAILKPLKLYATVYPNKVFDYLAAGRPVLLAIDGPIREVVEQASAGVFVHPGDPAALAAAIRQLAADPAAARKMGLAGRAYLQQHFDRQGLAKQMEETILALRAS